MLVVLFCLLFNVIDGVPLAKLQSSSSLIGGINHTKISNSNLMSKILSLRDNNEALVGILADADPAKLNEVISLLNGLLTTSRNELKLLEDNSAAADTAFTNAVNDHNAAEVDQTNGIQTLQSAKETAISSANDTYDQGVLILQQAVDDAKLLVDSTNSTKTTKNALLNADRDRLNSEINTLTDVIKMMEGLLGINTMSPTSSPTSSPTTTPCYGEADRLMWCADRKRVINVCDGTQSDCWQVGRTLCSSDANCFGFQWHETHGAFKFDIHKCTSPQKEPNSGGWYTFMKEQC